MGRYFRYTFIVISLIHYLPDYNCLKMNSLKLNEIQNLAIEPNEKQLRLVVFKNGTEDVCRKEYLDKLKRFILSDETRLFKGRLQLIKTPDSIGVEVKGTMAGYIKKDDFLGFLESKKL